MMAVILVVSTIMLLSQTSKASAMPIADESTVTTVISNQQHIEFDVNAFDYNKQIADAGLADLDPTDYGASKGAMLRWTDTFDLETTIKSAVISSTVDGSIGYLKITVTTHISTAGWMEWFFQPVVNTITTFESMSVELSSYNEKNWDSSYSVDAYIWVDSRAGTGTNTFTGSNAVDPANQLSTAHASILNSTRPSTSTNDTVVFPKEVNRIYDSGTVKGTSHGVEAKYAYYIKKDGDSTGIGEASSSTPSDSVRILYQD